MFCCCQVGLNLEKEVFEKIKNIKITKNFNLQMFDEIIKQSLIFKEKDLEELVENEESENEDEEEENKNSINYITNKNKKNTNENQNKNRNKIKNFENDSGSMYIKQLQIKEKLLKSFEYDYEPNRSKYLSSYDESNESYENLHFIKVLEISEYNKDYFYLNIFPFLNDNDNDNDINNNNFINRNDLKLNKNNESTLNCRADEFCKLMVKVINKKIRNKNKNNGNDNEKLKFKANSNKNEIINENLIMELNSIRRFFIKYTLDFLDIVYKPFLELPDSDTIYYNEIDMRFKVAFNEEIISKFIDKIFLFLSSNDELNTSANNCNISNTSITLVKKSFKEDILDYNNDRTYKVNVNTSNLNNNNDQRRRNNSLGGDRDRERERERNFSSGKNYYSKEKFGNITFFELRNFIEINKFFMNSELFLKEILKYMEKEKRIQF